MKGLKSMMLFTSLQTYLSVIYLLTPPIFASANEEIQYKEEENNYGILLDAGSSSTKLKIYRWYPPAASSCVPRLELIISKRHKPGLDRYENDARELTDYLDNILTTARDEIPATKHGETPIFLMATAGLRFLSATDAGHLMEATRAALANKTLNPFLYTPNSVSIISGEEEGVYSWVATNYLLGFFDSYKNDNDSVGVLEMGGGSTQITFIPRGPLFSEEFQVSLVGRQYQLYAQSYLQYGSNSMKHKVAHWLAERDPNNNQIENPCMLREDSAVRDVGDGRTITEIGTGAPRRCLALLRDLLKPYTGIKCQPKPCAIGSVYQPSVANMQFYAIQGYVYTPRTLNVVGQDGILRLDLLEEAAFKHCRKSLQQVVSEGMSEQFASADCLMGLYIPTILTVSYGFSRETNNIRLASKIGDQSVDWAVGAMLKELSNFMPKSDHMPGTCGVAVGRVTGENSAVSTCSLTLVLCIGSVILGHLLQET